MRFASALIVFHAKLALARMGCAGLAPTFVLLWVSPTIVADVPRFLDEGRFAFPPMCRIVDPTAGL